GGADRSAAVWQVVPGDVERLHVLGVIARDGDGAHRAAADFLGKAHPCEWIAADLGDGLANVPEELRFVTGVDNSLVARGENAAGAIGVTERRFGAFAFCNVADDAMPIDDSVAFEFAGADFDREGVAVLATVPAFEDVGAGLGQMVPAGVESGELRWREEVCDGELQQLIQRVAVGCYCAIIGLENTAAVVEEQNDIVHVLPEAGVAFLESAVRVEARS